MKSKIITLFFILSLFLNAELLSQESESRQFMDWLSSKPGLEIKKVSAPDSMFIETFEIMFEQPLDHENQDSPKFKQQIYLSLYDKNAPVVFVNEGYEGYNITYELSKILQANQIIVEHRYFAESTPDSSIFDWNYLTVRQAAADHHAVVKLFKEYFTGKWLNTGISKGGQTVMYHRRFYPDDVDVSVPYVGPLNFSPTDERAHEFLKNVSSEECRKKVHDFQVAALENKDELLKMFYSDAEQRGYTYSIGFTEALEYSVLEYSFAYWQWSDGDCSKIPGRDAGPEEIYNHLVSYSPLDYFSDQGIKQFEPFFYQAFTEIGYYDYDISEFQGLIEYVDGSNKCFYPHNFSASFNPAVMQDINNWIQNEGNNFIFIYGEFDPWSSTSVQLTGKTNSIKMVKKGGSHATRINSFSGEEKKLIYDKLEEWMGVDIK